MSVRATATDARNGVGRSQSSHVASAMSLPSYASGRWIAAPCAGSLVFVLRTFGLDGPGFEFVERIVGDQNGIPQRLRHFRALARRPSLRFTSYHAHPISNGCAGA